MRVKARLDAAGLHWNWERSGGCDTDQQSEAVDSGGAGAAAGAGGAGAAREGAGDSVAAHREAVD